MEKELLYTWLAGEYALFSEEKYKLLNYFGDIKELYFANEQDYRQALDGENYISPKLILELTDKDLSFAKLQVKKCHDYGAEIITMESPDYPKFLYDIQNPPICLFIKGDKTLLLEQGIAVVGTRRSSPYGRWASAEIAKKIALAGISVVSGMAEGIDTAAHKGCLDVNGKTIAVFGTGIDQCFPVSNKKLFDTIGAVGLTVSELPPGCKGMPQNFPQRNRIISALSSKVIVVEGAIKSGSMITANFALTQGREVFAVPGNINQPNSYGANYLIFDGATPILSIDELYQTLQISGKIERQRMAAMTKEEREVYTAVREAPGCSLEYVIDSAGLDIVLGARLISAMELKGMIRRDGNRIYLK